MSQTTLPAMSNIADAYTEAKRAGSMKGWFVLKNGVQNLVAHFIHFFSLSLQILTHLPTLNELKPKQH
jgi:hypothetical protein